MLIKEKVQVKVVMDHTNIEPKFRLMDFRKEERAQLLQRQQFYFEDIPH